MSSKPETLGQRYAREQGEKQAAAMSDSELALHLGKLAESTRYHPPGLRAAILREAAKRLKAVQ